MEPYDGEKGFVRGLLGRIELCILTKAPYCRAKLFRAPGREFGAPQFSLLVALLGAYVSETTANKQMEIDARNTWTANLRGTATIQWDKLPCHVTINLLWFQHHMTIRTWKACFGFSGSVVVESEGTRESNRSRQDFSSVSISSETVQNIEGRCENVDK